MGRLDNLRLGVDEFDSLAHKLVRLLFKPLGEHMVEKHHFLEMMGEHQSTYSLTRFLDSLYQLVRFQFFHLRYVAHQI